jgi:hypothetical protein
VSKSAIAHLNDFTVRNLINLLNSIQVSSGRTWIARQRRKSRRIMVLSTLVSGNAGRQIIMVDGPAVF